MNRALYIAVAATLSLGAINCSGQTNTPADSVGQTPPKAAAGAGVAEQSKSAAEVKLATELARADQAFHNDQYDKAGEMFEAVANDALGDGDTSTFVEAASMRARCYLERGDKEKGRPWLEKAREKADQKQPRGWSRYLGVRGRFEWKDGDSPRATATFREMFDYCQSHEMFDRAVDAAHMIAITGDPEERFEWSKKAIDMAERSGMRGWLAPLWNNLGWDYVDAGQYDDARAALEKAREYHYMGTAPIPKLIADYSVAYVIRLQGKLDEAHDAMTAVFNRAKELDAGGNPDAAEWIGFSRWELGEIAVAKGDADAGIAMMKQALGELEGAGIEKWDPADWQKRKDRLAELEAK